MKYFLALFLVVGISQIGFSQNKLSELLSNEGDCGYEAMNFRDVQLADTKEFASYSLTGVMDFLGEEITATVKYTWNWKDITQITLDANRTNFILRTAEPSIEVISEGGSEMTSDVQLYICGGNSICEKAGELMLSRIKKAGGSATYTAE